MDELSYQDLLKLIRVAKPIVNITNYLPKDMGILIFDGEAYISSEDEILIEKIKNSKEFNVKGV